MMDRSFLRRYAASGAVIAGLYLLNRFLLVPLTSCRLLAWHGADFLAGGLMLCLLNGLLCLTRRRPVERALPASLFLLALRPFLGSGHASVPAPIRGRPPGCPGGVAGGRGSAVPLAGVGPAGAWKLNMSKRPRAGVTRRGLVCCQSHAEAMTSLFFTKYSTPEYRW